MAVVKRIPLTAATGNIGGQVLSQLPSIVLPVILTAERPLHFQLRRDKTTVWILPWLAWSMIDH
jgi:hypothetical protein